MGTRLLKTFNEVIVTSPFGIRTDPNSGKQKMHNGIDIVGTDDGVTGYADDVKCHTGGNVIAVGYDETIGNFIKIMVEDGSVMVYYHLKNKPNYEIAQYVKTGEVIGRIGKTGNATGKHLHFGIKKNGKWIDPEPYLNTDYLPSANDSFEIPKNVCGCVLPVLKKGDKNTAVKNMQNILIDKGYKFVDENSGKDYGADGSFGKTTENVLMKYQQDNNLALSGVTDAEFWQSVISK